MTGIDYDEGLVRQIASTLDMRKPNAAALTEIAKALEFAVPGAEIVADLATGVGKTYIAGGLLDYLQQQGVRNVVIITPGSTIQRKTVNNLTPGHPKYLRGLQCRPVVITLDADFHAILAVSGASRPSVIRLRLQGLGGPEVAEVVQRALLDFDSDLRRGALITGKTRKITCHRLPVGFSD